MSRSVRRDASLILLDLALLVAFLQFRVVNSIGLVLDTVISPLIGTIPLVYLLIGFGLFAGLYSWYVVMGRRTQDWAEITTLLALVPGSWLPAAYLKWKIGWSGIIESTPSVPIFEIPFTSLLIPMIPTWVILYLSLVVIVVAVLFTYSNTESESTHSPKIFAR